ncbi:MAG TPA: sulfotransferase domain-containing protein, partial [Acidimicrobiia bacterium]|nr:sulfotransferase domain-containing protein [Acidimicrobiia bacterium]
MQPLFAPTREYRHHTLDSTRWDSFQPRPDDVIIVTPYKSGTTWMQQIVGLMLLWPDLPAAGVRSQSPWVDARWNGPVEDVLEELEAQQHRRFIKSHLAADGLPFWAEISYIVVGRDLRDIFMSLWNHYSNHTEEAFEFMNGGDRPGPPLPHAPKDERTLWKDWATRGWFPWEYDGWPYWSSTHHLATWWEHRHRPN